MEIVLSIGLNVGKAEPDPQLGVTLDAVLYGCVGQMVKVAMGESQWEGVPERFVQVLFDVPESRIPDVINYSVPVLARQLKQVAIGVSIPQYGEWILCKGDGTNESGGSTEEFPIIV